MLEHEQHLTQLDQLAEEFLAQLRQGIQPDLAALAADYPELAEQIRSLFPTLQAIERIGERADVPTERIPERIGEYRIIRLLGQGGMGIVYEAQHVSLGRRVALKTLPPNAAAKSGILERFQREARIASKLHHSQIVPIFDTGEENGTVYIAMQYIEGHPLKDVIQAVSVVRQATNQTTLLNQSSDSLTLSASHLLSGPDEQYFRRVAQLIAQAAEAIDYAHAQGVLHRDLKPSNLLLDQHNTLWVADFGLATATGEDDLTNTGDVLGTLRYLAPERLAGKGGPSADIYALGATLYELLTLRPAFNESDRVRLVRQIAREDPPRPRTLNAHIPTALEIITLKAMHHESSARYSTAGAFADDLRRYVADRPIAARRLTRPERVRLWAKRNPGVAFLSSTLVLFLVVGLMASSGAAYWMKQQRDAARQAEERAREAERERTTQLRTALLNKARVARTTNTVGQRSVGLEAFREMRKVNSFAELTDQQRAELREELGACLIWPDVVEAKRQAVPFASLYGMVSDGDLNHVVFGTDRDRPIWLRTGDPQFRHDTELPPHVRVVQRYVSPNGQRFVECFSAVRATPQPPGRVRVWDFAKHTQPVLEREITGTVHVWASFSQDGQQLVVASDDGKLRQFELSRPFDEPRCSPARFRPCTLAVHPNGKEVAVASNNGGVEVVDLNTWETVRVIPINAQVTALAWRPQTNDLVAGDVSGFTYHWKEQTNQVELEPEKQTADIVAVLFSQDGRWQATCSWDGSTWIKDRVGGHGVFRMRGQVLGFAPDNKTMLVLLDKELIHYSFENRGAVWTLSHWAKSLNFSADGKWIATAGYTGVRLWSAHDHQLRGDLELDHCHECAFHPQRNLLTTVGMFSQIRHWPLQTTEGGVTVVGPPQEVPLVSPQHDGRRAAWSANGRWLAVPDFRSGKVLMYEADNLTKPVVVPVDMKVSGVALSPDATWLISLRELRDGMKGMRRVDGTLIPNLPRHFSATFSPDGRWLITGGSAEYSVIDTRTWQAAHTITRREDAGFGPIAFTRDGRTLALGMSRLHVGLYDTATFQLKMMLTLRRLSNVVHLAFSPDGTQLGAALTTADTVGWNLSEIRQELAQLGLDWDDPPLPTRAPFQATKLEVQFGKATHSREHWAKQWRTLAEREQGFRGHLPDAINAYHEALLSLQGNAPELQCELLAERGKCHRLNGAYEFAFADWNHSLQQRNKFSTRTALALARLLVLGPKKFHDPRRALSLALGTAGEEKSPTIPCVLGAAYYRLQRYEQARDELHNVMLHDEWGVITQFFLAATYAQLKEPTKANDLLAKAQERLTQIEATLDRVTRSELQTLRREVEDLLR